MATPDSEEQISPQPPPPNPDPLGPPSNPSLTDSQQTPFPARGGEGLPVVQANTSDDLPVGGGSLPVQRATPDVATEGRSRAWLPIVVAVVVAVLLALPVLWALVELVVLAGVIGPLIWLWGALLLVLVVATVVIGYRIAQSSF